MRRLVLYLLVFGGSLASNIPCGKSFIPCENDILNHQQELHSIDEAPFVSHRIPDGLLFVAAKEGERESLKLFEFRDVAFQYSGHPLSTSTAQFTRIHKADKKASDRSRSAFTSLAITKRLTAYVWLTHLLSAYFFCFQTWASRTRVKVRSATQPDLLDHLKLSDS
uniref:C2H2-type domain-containing protein n=1 Tax=Caenorhabditis japonica TaxID=281687 RepID=A0A8R1IDI2_CAEJA